MKGLVAAAAIAAVLVPASPAHAGDEAAARAAAKRGADWLRGLQQPNGSGLGGFGLTALAAGGLHPADVRVGDGPSAQERAQADWAAAGAGPRGTDLARSLLAAHAAGIDPTLITAERNFVAETLALFDGRRLYDPGAASSLSDDIFGTLGLAAVDAPQPILDALATFLRSQQTATGGWNFTEGAVNASVDMTGAGVGALCAAGVPTSDPAVAKALAFLRERQDPVTAGWGQNSDTAGWVRPACGCAATTSRTWTRNGRDPLDDLMSRQLAFGRLPLARHRHDRERARDARLDPPARRRRLHGRPARRARSPRRRCPTARRSRSASSSTTASPSAPARSGLARARRWSRRSRPRRASASGAPARGPSRTATPRRGAPRATSSRSSARSRRCRSRRGLQTSSSGSSANAQITSVARRPRATRDHDVGRGEDRRRTGLEPEVPAGAKSGAARQARDAAVRALSMLPGTATRAEGRSRVAT